MNFTDYSPTKIKMDAFLQRPGLRPSSPPFQSDHSFSSSSESSSDSLYSTAMRRDRMVATSLPTGSRLASCSLCSCTFRSWIPGGQMGRAEDGKGMEGWGRAVTRDPGVGGNSSEAPGLRV